MLIGFLADLHIANHRSHGGQVKAGINNRCRLTLDALERAVTKAIQLGVNQLYVLGDVFDTVRPEPQIVAEVQRILYRPRGVNEPDLIDVVILEGNHDMVSTTPGDHSLGPLTPNFSVIDEPVMWVERGTQILAVPFEPGPAVEWLPKRVKELLAGATLENTPSQLTAKRVLVTHVGISDHDTAGFMKATQDQLPAHVLGELSREVGIHLIAAGNWHFHRVFNLATPQFTKAVQVGTLCPTGWDNPGYEGHGTMPVWNSDTGELKVSIIPGPRFLNVAQDRAELGDVGLSAAELQGCQVYVRVKSDRDHMPRVQAQLQHLVDNNRIVAFEVVPDDVEARGAARTAATVARSAETLDAALAGYVEQMPLPDGVDRAAVLATAKSYLK